MHEWHSDFAVVPMQQNTPQENLDLATCHRPAAHLRILESWHPYPSLKHHLSHDSAPTPYQMLEGERQRETKEGKNGQPQ